MLYYYVYSLFGFLIFLGTVLYLFLLISTVSCTSVHRDTLNRSIQDCSIDFFYI